MRAIVLRSIAAALVFALMIPLAACGSTGGSSNDGAASDAQNTEGSTSDTQDAQNTDGATSPAAGDAESDNPTGTELFQVEESFMKTQERNNVMSYLNVDGEKRDELLAVVENLKSDADLSTVIGEVTGFLIQTPGDAGASNNVLIFSKGSEEEYNKLRDYYQGLDGGEVVFESDTNMIVEYSWGILNTCRYSSEFGQMVISFGIE